MKFLHLFLIINFVICYAGICGDTTRAAFAAPEAAESCHSMGHEKADSGNTQIATEKESVQDSPCCLETLVNSSPDEYSHSVFTVTLVLPVNGFYTQNSGHLKAPGDRLYRDHDPPDLQVSFSTFLL